MANTRLKDAQRRNVLLFKHVQFASMRFEIRSECTGRSSPLRLITRDGSCRLTLKKRLSDGQLIAGRLLLQFDELLWIVTDGTLLSALHLAQHVSQLMDEAPVGKQNLPNLSASISGDQLISGLSSDRTAQLFAKYDVKESSLHVLVQKLQLHLSDELQRSQFDSLKTGGGVHIQLCRLVLDLYPYHFLQDGKRHWFCYASPNPASMDQFLERHLTAHLAQLDPTILTTREGSTAQSSSDRLQQCVRQRFRNLFSSALVVRIGDIRVRCVSTSGASGRGSEEAKKPFLRTDGALPGALPSIHIELQQFFFFEGTDRRRASLRQRAPDPLAYVHIAPMMLCPDALTILWANAFLRSVQHGLDEIGALNQSLFNESGSESVTPERLPHVLIELILPTLQLNLNYLSLNPAISAASELNGSAMEVKCSRITLTNSLGHQNENVRHLHSELNKIRQSEIIERGSNEYPWMKGDLPPLDPSLQQLIGRWLSANSEPSHNWQLWHLQCEPIWVDSLSTNGQRRRALVDPFSLHCWAHVSPEFVLQPDQSPLNVIASLPLVNITADHNQFLLLIRILEQIDEMNGWLNSDVKHIAGQHQKLERPALINGCALLQQIRLCVRLAGNMNGDMEMANNPHKKLMRCVQMKRVLNKFEAPTVDSDDPLSMTMNEVIESESFVTTEELEDEEDLKSMRSDLSGDADRLALLILDDLQEEFSNGSERLFAGITGALQDEFDFEPVEEALEMTEELALDPIDSPSLSNDSGDHIWITINRLLAVRQQIADGSASSIVEIPDIDIQFTTDEQTDHDDDNDDDGHQSLILRLDSVPQVDQKLAKQFATIWLRNLNSLHVSAVLVPKITDFLTDPETTQVHCMLALFENSRIRLLDPLVRTPPLELCLHHTLIERNERNQLRFSSLDSFALAIGRLKTAHQQLRCRQTHAKLSRIQQEINDESFQTGETVSSVSEPLVNGAQFEQQLSALHKDNETLRALVESLKSELHQLQQVRSHQQL